MRLTTILFSIFTATTLSLAACGGGDDGGGGGGGDDTESPDANESTAPDANETTAKQLGDSCVPDAVTPGGPGDCGAGMACLSLMGGNGAWCSKTCTPATQQNPTADTCNVGYTGPGVGSCVFGISFMQGGTPVQMCGIICSTVDAAECGAECNGTCPSTLQCSAGLSETMGGPVVANACI